MPIYFDFKSLHLILRFDIHAEYTGDGVMVDTDNMAYIVNCAIRPYWRRIQQATDIGVPILPELDEFMCELC